MSLDMDDNQPVETANMADTHIADKSRSPQDLVITIRDEHFGRGQQQARWWLGNDPIASAFYNALSVTFPKGEAYFIDSVRAFRDQAPERLQSEIRAFIRQEVNHSREHVAFNKRVVDASYDISTLEADVDEALAMTKDRSAIVNLMFTAALEHFTAILAQVMLKDHRHFAESDPEMRDMWLWHAIEEIEHKGVAYDTFLHASKDWSGWESWKRRSLVMLVVTKNFTIKRTQGILELLRQDGLSGPKIWMKLFWYAFGKPGMLRKIFPAWLSWFKPGFHPWQHDDRYLIQKTESEYRAANLDREDPISIAAE